MPIFTRSAPVDLARNPCSLQLLDDAESNWHECHTEGIVRQLTGDDYGTIPYTLSLTVPSGSKPRPPHTRHIINFMSSARALAQRRSPHAREFNQFVLELRSAAVASSALSRAQFLMCMPVIGVAVTSVIAGLTLALLKVAARYHDLSGWFFGPYLAAFSGIASFSATWALLCFLARREGQRPFLTEARNSLDTGVFLMPLLTNRHMMMLRIAGTGSRRTVDFHDTGGYLTIFLEELARNVLSECKRTVAAADDIADQNVPQGRKTKTCLRYLNVPAERISPEQLLALQQKLLRQRNKEQDLVCLTEWLLSLGLRTAHTSSRWQQAQRGPNCVYKSLSSVARHRLSGSAYRVLKAELLTRAESAYHPGAWPAELQERLREKARRNRAKVDEEDGNHPASTGWQSVLKTRMG